MEKTDKTVFGTKEWAVTTLNIIDGCSNNCHYCYAKEMAVRFKRKTPENWVEEKLNPKKFKTSKRHKKVDGRIMYPSTHDITLEHLDSNIEFLKDLLEAGNQLLIVSKPLYQCIESLVAELIKYSDNILFRFTIGHYKDTVLEFWEPNAPSFQERLDSLELAYKSGFGTSVSCEPILTSNRFETDELIKLVRRYVNDAIWIGTMNRAESRLKRNGVYTEHVADEYLQLERFWRKGNVLKMYDKYKNDPKIKWKESLKKIIGLEVPTEAGLDI